MRGAFLDRTLMQWKWTEEEIVIPVRDLGIWPVIAGTREEEEQWKGEEWNMEKEDLRVILNRSDI